MKLTRLIATGALALLTLGTAFAADAPAPMGGVKVRPVEGLSKDSIRGVDISTLAELEALGVTYSDAGGTQKDIMQILKDSGVNWVRLRIWNNPVNSADVIVGDKVISKKGDPVGGGSNDLAKTVSMAKRVKAAGLSFLLDIHYSDFWADPGKQTKPEAWKDLTGDALRKAVYDYTDSVMKALIAAGARPDMVQVGNELNGGFLWPDGKTWKEKPEDTIGGNDGFIALMKQGIKAVRDNEKGGTKIKIAIHLANGADNALYRRIFDPIVAAHVDFDVIGLSFYPYWHGSLPDLAINLKDLSGRYKKELVVMETAYGYTYDNGDDCGNMYTAGNEKAGGYQTGVQGQASLIRDMLEVMSKVPGGRGLGLFWWEPAWIGVKGSGWRTGEGNAWDNQTLFDAKGKALPSLAAYGKALSGGDADFVPAPVATKPMALKAVVGEKFSLPSTVIAVYSDASFRDVAVTWDSFDAKSVTRAGKVTVNGKLKGSGLPVSAEVSFTDIKNLVTDGSFEKGSLDEWTVSDPMRATMAEKNPGNAHSGDWSYKYWAEKDFQTMLTHTFTGLENGTYTLSVWASGGGGEKSIKLFARDFGGKTLSALISNTGWQKWKQYTISKIQVSNGKCTIGIFSDAKGGNWANFDDIEFYLEKE